MNKDENKKETIVQKPKVEDFDVSKSLEEHMEENRKNVKKGFNFQAFFTYVLMVIIICVCAILLIHFCKDSIIKSNKPTTMTLPNYITKTTSRQTQSIKHVRTTPIKTAATHTVFVGNITHRPSNNEPVRTSNIQIRTTVPSTTITTTTTTIAPTTTTTTTTTTTESTTTKTTEETTKTTEETTTTSTTEQVTEEN